MSKSAKSIGGKESREHGTAVAKVAGTGPRSAVRDRDRSRAWRVWMKC